jgi:atlastin
MSADAAAASRGQPLQIVKIDGSADAEADSFDLVTENLESIAAKIPAGTKVSILSVVGAFRTGKSFLLNFFLRYLRYGDPNDETNGWMTAEGATLSEGNQNELKVESDKKEASFAWRGGEERQTTGIWMWSEPFIRETKSSDGPVAILLMDTQGMFDNETSMALTAQIFGLSTFVSSYQV